MEENNPPHIKEENKVSEISNLNQLPKTLLTQKTEDNYDLLIKYFKNDNYKRGDNYNIDDIINYEDFSSDKFLGLAPDKNEINNKKKILLMIL